MKRKLLSILLCLVMALSLLPTAALAEEGVTATPTGETVTANVAKVGETEYATLAAAVEAVTADNNTVTLLKDTTVPAMITLKKSLTLDLNGHKLNGEGNTASWVQVVDNAKLTINGTVAGSAAYGRMNLGIASNNNGSLEINGGIYAVGDEQTVLHINGTCMSSDVTINGATIKATNDNGIQLNGKGTFSITNSEITGGTGIYIKAGTLTLENTKVTGTRNPVNYSYNGNGANATGDAVVIDACNYPGGDPTITIKSGVFGGSKAAIGYYQHSGSDPTANPGTAAISITGGTFSSDVSAYVADGYTYNSETKTIEPLGETNAVAKVGDTYYKTLAAAIAAAQDSETIKLLKNVTENVTIPADKTITLDLNGMTLTNVDDHTILNNGNLTITGTGTVDNISHAKGALYNKGTAVINGGTFDRSHENGMNKGESGQNSWYTIKNVGTMTINDGATVQTAGNDAALGKFSSLVSNGYFNANDYDTNKGLDQPILTIDGGTFRGGLNTIKNDDRAKLTINGGTFSNYYQAVVQNHNIAEITGGTFTAASDANAETYGIYNCGCDAEIDLGTLTVSGGTFTGATYAVAEVSSQGAIVNISGGQFAGTEAAIIKSSTSNATIAVSGGTFSSAVPGNCCAPGFEPTQNDDDTYGVKIMANLAAEVLDAQGKTVGAYDTLAAAITAAGNGDTVTLLKDVTNGDGVKVPSGKNFTLDFANHTYTVTQNLAGSTGTESQCFQLLKDSTLTFKNGTIKANNGNVAMIIQNYSNLTLENMLLDGESITRNDVPIYTMSNNCGNVVIKDTTINTVSNGFAFDVYGGFGDYSDVTVTVTGSSEINGKIEVDRGSGTQNKNTLAINGGTINGALVFTDHNKTSITISGGNFSQSVDKKYLDSSLTAELKRASGKTPYSYYTSVAAATAAAQPGDTVTDLYATTEQEVTLTLKYNDGATADTTYNVASGTTITLPTPAYRSGYTFNGWYDGSKFYAAGASYTVSATVTLNAFWSYISSGSGSYVPTYSVSTPSKTENGSVTVSPKNASKGDTVTVTVKPDSGYVLETLTVTDKNGNKLTLKYKGNGKYTFTMPASKVEVKATFMEDNSMLNFFYDVPNGAYFYEAVKWAVKNGITTGVGNDLFAPEQPCTRAQIVTFLWRAAGSPEPKGAASGMTDVVSGSYYEKAVAWAIENGITTGTTTSTFSPDATCTRAQAVTFLARALNAKATSVAEFSDVPTNSYFADAVAWAAANGVTEGIGGGLFGSDNDCTRGQIVTFLYRAYNK